MKLYFAYFLGVSLLFFSCTSNTLDDVMDPIDPGPNLVTYQDVDQIFANNCTQCHSNPPQNGAPMPLVSFETITDAIETRGLLDRISRTEGANGLMPLGGPRLPQTTIDLINQWNDDGLLEN